MVESNEMKALKYSESAFSKASIASYHPFLDLSYLLSLQYPPLL